MQQSRQRPLYGEEGYYTRRSSIYGFSDTSQDLDSSRTETKNSQIRLSTYGRPQNN